MHCQSLKPHGWAVTSWLLLKLPITLAYIPQMHLAREFDPVEQVSSFSEIPKFRNKKFKQQSRRHATSQRTAVHLQYSLQNLETFCNLILAILASYID